MAVAAQLESLLASPAQRSWRSRVALAAAALSACAMAGSFLLAGGPGGVRFVQHRGRGPESAGEGAPASGAAVPGQLPGPTAGLAAADLRVEALGLKAEPPPARLRLDGHSMVNASPPIFDCEFNDLSLQSNNNWAYCAEGRFMAGLYRNTGSYLDALEKARCCKYAGPDYASDLGACHHPKWEPSFNSRGWSFCPAGTAMTGLFRSGGAQILYLDDVKCCPLPHGSTSGCRIADWHTSMSKEGWSECPGETVMTGLYRGDESNQLFSISLAQCCPLV